MTVKLAINGFGRIGRLVLRSIMESGRNDVSVVGINDLATAEANAHLLRFDSVHGRFDGEVKVSGNKLIVNGHEITMTQTKDPTQLPWKDLNVDIAMECTGIFTKKDDAVKHLAAGAKKFVKGLGGLAYFSIDIILLPLYIGSDIYFNRLTNGGASHV